MTEGITTLYENFALTNTSTAEEIRTFIKSGVDKFCEMTGLVIISTVEHEKGGMYFLGESGKEQGIIAIGNFETSSYNQIGFLNVGMDNSTRATGFSGNLGTTGKLVNFSTSYRNLYIRYVKTDSMFAFALDANQALIFANYTISIIKISNLETEQLACLFPYSGNVGASYNILLDNLDNKSVLSYSQNYGFEIPNGKEAVLDVYVAKMFKSPFRLYTNRLNVAVGNKVTIEGVKYIVLYSMGSSGYQYYSIIARISEESSRNGGNEGAGNEVSGNEGAGNVA